MLVGAMRFQWELLGAGCGESRVRYEMRVEAVFTVCDTE